MRAVRANATIGFISGKHATTGRRVKPRARRSGLVISSALQMVGVSQARRASRLWREGKSGIGFSPLGAVVALWTLPRARKGFSATPASSMIAANEISEDEDERGL